MTHMLVVILVTVFGVVPGCGRHGRAQAKAINRRGSERDLVKGLLCAGGCECMLGLVRERLVSVGLKTKENGMMFIHQPLTHLHLHLHTNTHTQTHANTHTHKHTQTHIYTPLTFTHTHTLAHSLSNLHTYTHKHTHTDIHTQTTHTETSGRCSSTPRTRPYSVSTSGAACTGKVDPAASSSTASATQPVPCIAADLAAFVTLF